MTTKPRAYHATELSLVNKHCAKALEFKESGVPVPRDVFQVGISAHAVLDAVGRQTNEAGRELTDVEVRDIGQQVALQLISSGRSFDKVPEPAMKPDAAFAGRDLALDWLAFNPLSPGASYEIGLALDAKGSPVPYWSDEARVKCILDVVRIEDEVDEETSRTVLTVCDWKSAWSTDEAELDTLQRKVQAVIAWKYFGESAGATMLRMRVVNLRTQKPYDREYWAEDDLRATIASWTRDILSTCAALDEQKRIGRGKRPASPGAGCHGCAYLLACPDAQDYIERRGMHKSSEKKAIAFAVAKAMVDELADELRLETDEGPVAINGGWVGTAAKDSRELTEDAHEVLAEAWQGLGGEIVGFAKALSLSVRNAEKMARVLYYDRKDKGLRDQLVESISKPSKRREFGVFRGPTQDATTGDGK